MKTSQIMLLNAYALAALTMSGIAAANETTKEGYLLDNRGAVVRSGAGLCLHTSIWTPALAIAECDSVAKKPAPVIAEAAPAPAPSPVPAPPPARVVQKKTVFVPYTMETETLFSYNKSDLSEGGKQKLHDEIIGKMQEEPRDEVVVVSGYTDRIGSEEYNIKLSQRRADAVKAYMVDQGVDGNRIETAAKGKADPVVSCDYIKGKSNRKNKALIACLQPNRRIVLDLKGQMPVKQ
jgi:OOP family OmpA-OmpF porin